MGGMYTNMIGSTEPRIRAVVPTGAGGFWTYFILKTSLIPGADKKIALILQTQAALTFMHPVVQVRIFLQIERGRGGLALELGMIDQDFR